MENDILSAAWPEWKVVRRINRGSYGVVYEAVRTDHGVESRAAIKVISIPQDEAELESLRSAGLTPDATRTYLQEVVSDFANEIRIMESFKGSQNIVSVEDYKVVEKTDRVGWDIYIRMELLTPLNTYISDKDLSEEEVVKLGCDICSALERCARRNVIHRDIKPDNIFINEFGDFKLGDFGIARKLENVSGGLSQKGTINYMAPEVFRGNSYNATVDIYSLGIVLYWLMNKRRLPFVNTEKQILRPRDVAEANRRRLDGESLLPPCNASAAMANVILQACDPDPDQRFASATAMKTALMSVVYGKYASERNAGRNAGRSAVSEINEETITSDRGVPNGEPVHYNEHYGEPVHHSAPYRARNSPDYTYKEGRTQVAVNSFGEKKSAAKPVLIAAIIALVFLVGGGTFFSLLNRGKETSDEEETVEAVESPDAAEEAIEATESSEKQEETAEAENADVAEEPQKDTAEAQNPAKEADTAEARESSNSELPVAIEWGDPVLEARVRSFTGNFEKDFLREDAEKITELDLTTDQDLPDSEKIHDISALRAFKNLKVLTLDGNNVHDISAIASLANLQQLYIRNNRARDISPLAELYNLEVLDLTDNYISDISAVRRLTGLTELRFGGNEVEDISPVVNLTNLTVLRFSDNEVSSLAPVMNLTHLTALRFSDNNISSINALAGLTELRDLWFYNNNVDDISVLSGLTELQYLYMAGNEISDISAIMDLNKLKELAVYGNNVSSEQIREFEENVPDCDVKWQ